MKQEEYKSMRTIRFLARCFAAILVTMTLFSVLPVKGEADIYGKVVRLHVLANSDTDADQQLKLTVRDKVLQRMNALFYDCQDVGQAEQVANEHLTELQGIAENVIAQEGYDYPCQVTLTKEAYPMRDYGDFRFPAGTYTSLRILIGKAEGHNWWCVLFPPLCLSSASQTFGGGGVHYDNNTDEVLYEAGFSPKQVEILTDSKDKKVVAKFKIVEIFEKWFG